MSDKIICIISIIGAIVSFILFIAGIIEGIRMYKDAYSKETKTTAKGAFIVSVAILMFGVVCLLSAVNFWAW